MASRRLDILFITRKWPPAMGGMETYSARLTEMLARKHSVEVISLPGRPDGGVPGALALLQFAAKTAIGLLFRRRMPQVVHIGDMASWPFALIALIRRPSTRIVLSAHGTDVSYGRRFGWRGGLYRLYLRMGARLLSSSAVIANSHATATAAAEAGYQQAKVVPLATDMRGGTPDHPIGQNLLFAGRLVPLKGLSWFTLNVLPCLPENIHLDVAGSVWDAEEAQCLKHPRVNYLGILPQHELATAYSRALCVIVPNVTMDNGEFEGFGLVATEAAAVGGVVLAAGSGGLTDAVIDGTTGFLLPSGQPQAWIEKIREVSAWPGSQRREFTDRSMQEVGKWYSWDRVADETAKIYEI